MAPPPPPIAFLSHGPAGANLALKLAGDLQGCGIEVKLDKWDVRSGTSIPGFMNDALGSMTHFLLLATGADHDRPWVTAEWQAAFVRKINDGVAFIPIRHGLKPSDLPPLLNPYYSPSLDDYDAGLKQLVDDIHGLTVRPPLGPPPRVLSTPAPTGPTGLSPVAEALARLIATRPQATGYQTGSSIEPREIREILGATDETIIDAVDELEKGYYLERFKAFNMGPIGFRHLEIRNSFFYYFDRHFMSWVSIDDAMTIAVMMVNADKDKTAWWLKQDIDAALGWGHRRLNPAVAWLIDYGKVGRTREIGDHPYMAPYITKTDETRRFVKNASR